MKPTSSSYSQLAKDIEKSLRTLIHERVKEPKAKEIYEYALFPPGKLFRPLLAYSLALDIDPEIQRAPKGRYGLTDIELFSAALEIHHVYTLCHDDLPCMDDDDFRRGKPSLHKAYSEGEALLIGDGLLNLSYEILFHLQHTQGQKLGQYFAAKLGADGLIHGQKKDLSGEMKRSLNDLLETHRLKTGRLLEVSLWGGYLLATREFDTSKAQTIEELGVALGLVFQLLDDLGELCEDERLGEHEQDINPWPQPQTFDSCLETTSQELDNVERNVHELGLAGGHLADTLSQYFQKIQ